MLAGITLFGCVRVPFQIKTRQVFRQLLQILPRVTGKTGNICPSPVPYIYTADDDPHTCSESLLRLNQTGSGAAGSAAAAVVFNHHQTLPCIRLRWRENKGAEWRQPDLKAAAFVLWGNCWSERPAECWCQSVCVIMRQGKEEEFVFLAIYRQEWCLWHSSCSTEIGDTLTFSQLSWPAA